jgi:hypothetical protein
MGMDIATDFDQSRLGGAHQSVDLGAKIIWQIRHDGL